MLCYSFKSGLSQGKVTANELQQSIRREIAAIPASMLHGAMVTMAEKARKYALRGGDHLKAVIFKTSKV